MGPSTFDGRSPDAEREDRRDRFVLIAARTVRGFAAGGLSIVLALDLANAGYPVWTVGLLLGLALGGGALWAILVPRLELGRPRRAVLVLCAVLFALGGFLLWAGLILPAVVVAAVLLGGIAASTSDASPLGALEQAALAGATGGEPRTELFALYNLLGYVGNAAGALLAGVTAALPVGGGSGFAPGPHDPTFLLYGLLGLGLVPAYRSLSERVDRRSSERVAPLSTGSRPTVYALSELFAVDAFGGGMIANTLVVYYLAERFHPPVEELGALLAGASLLAAVSFLLAAPLARRFGLIPTMVFTHLPSSVLLVLFPFGPSFLASSALWLGRSVISQMDVPTRQSYTQAVVPPEDRTAAAGYTTAARGAQAFGAPVTGAFLASGGPWVAGPFVLAGSLKIAYDLALYSRFKRLRAPGDPPERPLPPRTVL